MCEDGHGAKGVESPGKDHTYQKVDVKCKTPKICGAQESHLVTKGGVHCLLWSEDPLHICTSGPCHLYYEKQITAGSTATQQDLHVQSKHYYTAEGCLKNTCFLFQGKDFEQVHGTAMGSNHPPPCQPVHGRVWNPRPSALSPIHPGFGSCMWMTSLTPNRQNRPNSSLHILFPLIHILNSQEAPSSNGFIPFLDILDLPEPKSTLYRKPTHTDQMD